MLAPGEHLPGLACDPASGDIAIELSLGAGGPLTVTPLDDRGFCQLGFGLVLVVGRTIELEESRWGERRIRGGTVRVGNDGLEYE